MKEEQKFYGYKVAFACFVIMFASYGSLSTFAIFLPEFIDGVNSDVATIGIMASFFGLGGVVGNGIAGKVFERIPLKWCAVIGNCMIALHYTLYSLATGVATLYIAATIAGIGMGIGTMSVSYTHLDVYKRQGLVMRTPMPLAVSMGLPPPSPMRISAPNSLAASAP